MGQALEKVLNETTHPEVEAAIEELNTMRAVQAHLLTHYVAIRRHNESLHDALHHLLPRDI